MALLLVALLVAGVVVLTPVADRISVPQPILLLLHGSGPIPAPLPGGRLADGPVGASVYRSLVTTTTPSAAP